MKKKAGSNNNEHDTYVLPPSYLEHKKKKKVISNVTLKMAFISNTARAVFQEEALSHIFAWLVVC